MAVRSATAKWSGGLKDGNGDLKLGSGAYDGQYSFTSRFEDGTGTNPEELLGAAHAGCYAMALSAGLERAGFSPESVECNARVHLTPKEGGGFEISKVELTVDAKVPDIEEAKFMEMAEATKETCIVSVALGGIPVMEITATLNA
ncbi:MAG: OsmC family peroxiredoxin [Chloroflexota bacterium]